MKTTLNESLSPKWSMKTLYRYALPALLASMIFTTACGEEDDHDHDRDHAEECGGFGHLHGDHCHCNEGYKQAPDDHAMCVAE